MYENIMVPVDLSHADRLDRALAAAADLARLYSAKIHVVGMASTAPGPVAHDPSEYPVDSKPSAPNNPVAAAWFSRPSR